MRIVTYNVEWFSHLFDQKDHLMLDSQPSGRFGVDRYTQGMALAHVFQTLDADAVLVVEAPNTGRRQRTIRALERFATEAGLRAREAVIGFANDTRQEIALLYDPDVLSLRHDPQGTLDVPRFDREFRIDLDVDARADEVRFSKPPLELQVKTSGGRSLRLIGAHLKSKAPHGVRGEHAILRRQIDNRRKQLAQAIWLRRRVDQHLAQGEDLILLGDLNDGPGLDEFEALFGRSTVEIVSGEDLFSPHIREQLGPGSVLPDTARFYDVETNRYFGACLDYVMISEGLTRFDPNWRIWHPLQDPGCRDDAVLRTALLAASDHFPVSLDLDLH